MWYNIEVGEIDSWDNQGNQWVSAMIFGIGEDREVGFKAFKFYRTGMSVV